ncbi:alkaline phosphatase D family protein [Mesorhizobium sp. B2-6-4]|uniref:alkaline phosphatase D family protein n=1 Tax=Mesorhizobium sp. B2-6-4 TaxID=2589913 RepID=UPI00112A770C|nr:alkaline phosphatase D family protein [Mesorhizobium sp. B2-6-4]TPJ52335.1 hypothetical protein FJ426_16475 [Mesorhizobium sp. B2-6-4]
MSGAGLDTDSGTAWISQGFERLVDRVRKNPAVQHFDVLIIGSGYGGAIAAATFAGRHKGGVPVTVGVLERGKEYLPGSFPTGLGELPRHIRRKTNKEGLFDVRLGAEVTTVVANGVGGGSLINAGVMEVPLAEVFQTGWPRQLSSLPKWKSFFERASELLGASINGAANTIANHIDGPPQKFRSISGIAPTNTFRPAAITVAMANSISSGKVSLNKCLRCGDCATGCNFGAKNSLDVNLLVRAQQNGAEIFSGATVLSIEKDGAGGWIVNSVYTNATLRARDGEVLKVRARKVVLAAGTLGSTEIMLRSRNIGLQVSGGQLGKRCSTNGDMLVADYGTMASVNTVANDAIQPSKRAIGPTITGIIDLRETAGVLIEEMSVPAGLRIAFAEIFATVNTLHTLDEIDWSTHQQGFPKDDAYVASEERIERSALYAVMSDDGAAGRIELDRATDEGDDSPAPYSDGIARMRWGKLPNLPVFDAQIEVLAGLAKNSGGRVIANPFWQLLPAELTWLLQGKRGALTTVHPLGGCTMADTGAVGVVDHLGRVFSTHTTSAVHDGLVVLDGSIVPTALGTNPALTISAIALRAAEELAKAWGYDMGSPVVAGATLVRPVFRSTDVPAPRPRTEVEIIERLVGPLHMRLKNGAFGAYVVELTLRFSPMTLADLTPSNGGDPTLDVATDQSELLARSMIRIFPQPTWDRLEKSWDPAGVREQQLDAIAEFSAPLTGTLKVLERQKTWVLGRMWRAGKAWLLNRGLRDIYQAIVGDNDGPGLFSRIYRAIVGDNVGPGLFSRVKSGLAIASRSGEIRALVYDLRIGSPDAHTKLLLSGDHIIGTKTFTYERRCNPWRQLMEVTLERFPGMSSSTAERVLKLDVGYLARIGVPLFRVTRQRDGVATIGELVTFLGYFVRLLLGQHIWSFRAPDRDIDPANDIVDFRPPTNLQLPGGGSVSAQIIDIPIGSRRPDISGKPTWGKVLVTRYPHPGTIKRPVVMLHGYSAGGTTFAHHAVNPNFASYLWNTGRDVWVADLRTSPAHRTARQAWSFDQIGNQDVRKVIMKAAEASFDKKVDVVAHCMGTIVFSIAALGGKIDDLVHRAAFTQVGPLVVFSPANVFRAYVVRYLIDFLPDTYEFNPKNLTLADDLLDRVLSTMPYPVEEFDIENPLWPTKRTPWTRTRHRMDALYGRDFNVANMEPEMLRYIDEHFGALSLRTVATTLHFARYSMMTNFRGQNQLVSRETFGKYWHFPTFSVHGAENGLSHVSTVDRMSKILGDAGCDYRPPFINPGAGHQDALVGTTRHATFQKIEQFLDDTSTAQQTEPDTEMTAYPPWIGPIITEERPQTPALVVRVGSMPSLRAPEAVLMLRIQVVGDQILRPDNPAAPWELNYIVNHLVVYKSPKLVVNRWDAFEVPLPALMPNYDSAHPGNALLVLLAYPDDKDFPTGDGFKTGYFRAVAASETVLPLDPTKFVDEVPIGGGTAFGQFKILADAASRLLEPLSARSKSYSEITPSRLGYFPPKLESRKLGAESGTSDVTLQTVVTPKTTTSLQFGVHTPTGVVLLPRLIEQDRNLMDGVIPYDPPQNPSRFPVPSGTSFSLASCQYPAGFIDEPVAYRSYGEMVARLEANAGIKPRFALFAGDQVYVDPTAGLYDPRSVDDRYRLPYEAWLRNRNVRNALRRIPSFMLLDDHEIDDNWEPIPDDHENEQKKTLGLKAYRKYQRGMFGRRTFNFDGFDFFMLDTRTERSHRMVGRLESAELFSPATMCKLKRWLLRKSGQHFVPKFVVSPVMLLPRHRRAVQRDERLDPSNLSAIHSDGWDGYPKTLRDVLAHIAANNIDHIVFLSGDEHRSCVATLDLLDAFGNPITRVHSVHTAALHAPYPFANSIDEDIVMNETIDIVGCAASYKCVVNATRPPAGDGMTFLRVRQNAGIWNLDCEFAHGTLLPLTL